MLIFGPLGGRLSILGHYSGPGPLRTKIFGSGGSSHIVGPGRVHILNLIYFFGIWISAGSEKELLLFWKISTSLFFFVETTAWDLRKNCLSLNFSPLSFRQTKKWSEFLGGGGESSAAKWPTVLPVTWSHYIKGGGGWSAKKWVLPD